MTSVERLPSLLAHGLKVHAYEYEVSYTRRPAARFNQAGCNLVEMGNRAQINEHSRFKVNEFQNINRAYKLIRCFCVCDM